MIVVIAHRVARRRAVARARTHGGAIMATHGGRAHRCGRASRGARAFSHFILL
jgi:hypothetical protein